MCCMCKHIDQPRVFKRYASLSPVNAALVLVEGSPHLTPFNAEEQRLLSKLLLDGRAPHTISKAEPSQHPKETHFSQLYLHSHSFDEYPEVMTIGEGWNKDGPVNWKLPSPVNKIPRYLISSAWGRNSSPIHATFFRLRTMASDLESWLSSSRFKLRFKPFQCTLKRSRTCLWKSQTGSLTRGSPGCESNTHRKWVWHRKCQECRHSYCFGYTGTG